MEPFHQLRLTSTAVPDVFAELESLGLSVTRKPGSWLGSKHPLLRDAICERDDLRTVLAIGPDSHDASHTVIVYVNCGDDLLIPVVREHFELLGASWGYFDS